MSIMLQMWRLIAVVLVSAVAVTASAKKCGDLVASDAKTQFAETLERMSSPRSKVKMVHVGIPDKDKVRAVTVRRVMSSGPARQQSGQLLFDREFRVVGQTWGEWRSYGQSIYDHVDALAVRSPYKTNLKNLGLSVAQVSSLPSTVAERLEELRARFQSHPAMNLEDWGAVAMTRDGKRLGFMVHALTSVARGPRSEFHWAVYFDELGHPVTEELRYTPNLR